MQPSAGFMNHITRRLTSKNRDQLEYGLTLFFICVDEVIVIGFCAVVLLFPSVL